MEAVFPNRPDLTDDEAGMIEGGREAGIEHARRLVRTALRDWDDDALVAYAHAHLGPEDSLYDRGFVIGFKEAAAVALADKTYDRL